MSPTHVFTIAFDTNLYICMDPEFFLFQPLVFLSLRKFWKDWSWKDLPEVFIDNFSIFVKLLKVFLFSRFLSF